MKKENSNPVFSAGIGYTIGNILIKGINFLILPLFSRIMTKEEFGIYNIFLSYDAILCIVIGMALHSSVKSANYKFANQIDQYISSVSLIYISSALGLLVINAIFGENLVSILALDKEVIYLLILFSFGNALLYLYNTRLSLDYAYKRYLIIAFFNTIGNVGLSLLFILTIFSDRKELGRIVGVVVTVCLISIIVLYSIYKKAKPRFEKRFWRFGILYSLPIIPHGLSQVVLAQFDRIMIGKLVNKSAAGVYGLAGNIKLILTVIIDSISNVWSTWFYEEIEKGNIQIIQTRSKQLCWGFCAMTVGMMAISPELIYILGGNKYALGKYVVIPMLLDAFIIFIYNVVVVAEYYVKKTVYIMLGTLGAAIINVILNYYFILRYGFIAAAYTTLFAYFWYLIFHIIISYKLIHFNVIPVKNICIDIIIVIILSVFDLFFINNIILRVVMGGGVILIMGLIWLFSLRKIENGI